MNPSAHRRGGAGRVGDSTGTTSNMNNMSAASASASASASAPSASVAASERISDSMDANSRNQHVRTGTNTDRNTNSNAGTITSSGSGDDHHHQQQALIDFSHSHHHHHSGADGPSSSEAAEARAGAGLFSPIQTGTGSGNNINNGGRNISSSDRKTHHDDTPPSSSVSPAATAVYSNPDDMAGLLQRASMSMGMTHSQSQSSRSSSGGGRRAMDSSGGGGNRGPNTNNMRAVKDDDDGDGNESDLDDDQEEEEEDDDDDGFGDWQEGHENNGASREQGQGQGQGEGDSRVPHQSGAENANASSFAGQPKRHETQQRPASTLVSAPTAATPPPRPPTSTAPIGSQMPPVQQLQHQHQQEEQQQRRHYLLEEVQAEQMRHLPQLPDVQDRKRILGCLAGILAGLYSYDVSGAGGDEQDGGEDANTNNGGWGAAGDPNVGGRRQYAGNSTASAPSSAPGSASGSAASLDVVGEEEEEEEIEENLQASQSKSKAKGSKGMLERYDSRPVYSDMDDSNVGDYDDDEDQDCDGLATATDRQGSDQAVIGAAESADDDEDDEFFDDSYYGDDAILTTSPSSAVANRMRKADSAPELPQQQQQQAGSGGPPGIPDQSLSSLPPEQQQRQQQKRSQPVAGAASVTATTPRQSMQLTTAPSRLFPRRHRRHTTELAIRRHRLRRYEVMSELLLSSAECLGLEERDVRGFMIMLDSLKTGNTGGNAMRGRRGSSSSGRQPKQKNSSRGRADRRSASSKSQQNQTATAGGGASSSQRSFFGGDRLRMEAEATQRSTGLMPIAGLAGSMEAEVAATAGAGRDDLNASYTSGTVDVSGWGDSPGDSRLQQRLQAQQEQAQAQVQEDEPAYDDSLEDDWTNPSMISPFLSELTPGAGFQCVSLLLLQHLLRSKSGYDCRARQVYKKLGVLVLMWEEKARYDVLLETETSDAGGSTAIGSDASESVEIRADANGEVLGIHHSPSTGEMSTSFLSPERKKTIRPADAELAARATRKFEALERATASKLITLSNQQSSSRRRKQQQQQEQEQQQNETDIRAERKDGAAGASAAASQQRQAQEPNPPKQNGHPSVAASAPPRQKAQQQQHQQQQQDRSKSNRNQQEPPQRRQQRPHAASEPPDTGKNTTTVTNRTGPRITRTQVMRGLKIGSAGVAAGALFALTGGLAAPGIAAGIAAMTASTTITAAGAAVVSTLTSTAAVCTIFGVGGGGLAAYKVSRRTQGVTEFTFRREDNGRARVRAEKAAAEARKAAAGSNLRRRLRGNAEHEAVAAAARAAAAQADAELYSVVCLSGWFKDVRDFQRPWGINPNNPPITDRLELLERFYAKYQPSKIHRCGRILAHWRGEERQLWRLLRQKYGRDPNESFPFDEGARFDAELTHTEDQAIDRLLRELGYDVPEPPERPSNCADDSSAEHGNDDSSRAHRAGEAIGRLGQQIADKVIHHNYEGHGAEDLSRMENQPSLHPIGDASSSVAGDLPAPTRTAASASGEGSSIARAPIPAPRTAPAALPSAPTSAGSANAGVAATAATRTEASAAANTAASSSTNAGGATTGAGGTAQSLPRHLNTVWDYTAEYGGELYTVRWESDLLMELCDSVTDMVVDVLGAGTRELLKQTALATLVTAIAIPYAMVRAADSIDSVWTLAVERADEAGIELAKSLLDSQAGHRPVTLLGFSMGARAVYSCLKELARHQEKWEDQRDIRRREEEQEAEMEANKKNMSMSADEAIAGKSSSNKSKSTKKSKSSSSEEERVYSREPASIVEDVILMGTPNHVSTPSWEAARRVVSGRLVNCYSTKDLILSVLFQYKRMTGVLRPVCGCAPVRVPGVENYDVTYLLNSHADYTLVAGDILRLVRHGQPQPTRSLGWYGQEKPEKPPVGGGGDGNTNASKGDLSDAGGGGGGGDGSAENKRSDGGPAQQSQRFIAPLGDERAEPSSPRSS